LCLVLRGWYGRCGEEKGQTERTEKEARTEFNMRNYVSARSSKDLLVKKRSGDFRTREEN